MKYDPYTCITRIREKMTLPEKFAISVFDSIEERNLAKGKIVIDGEVYSIKGGIYHIPPGKLHDSRCIGQFNIKGKRYDFLVWEGREEVYIMEEKREGLFSREKKLVKRAPKTPFEKIASETIVDCLKNFI